MECVQKGVRFHATKTTAMNLKPPTRKGMSNTALSTHTLYPLTRLHKRSQIANQAHQCQVSAHQVTKHQFCQAALPAPKHLKQDRIVGAAANVSTSTSKIVAKYMETSHSSMLESNEFFTMRQVPPLLNRTARGAKESRKQH